MNNSLKLQDIEANEDPLNAFNGGLEAGMHIGMKSPWIKFNYQDEATWPPLNTPMVGIYARGARKYPSISAKLVRFIEEPDGDGGHYWEEVKELGPAIACPIYWCPLPDPNDFEQ